MYSSERATTQPAKDRSRLRGRGPADVSLALRNTPSPPFTLFCQKEAGLKSSRTASLNVEGQLFFYHSCLTLVRIPEGAQFVRY